MAGCKKADRNRKSASNGAYKSNNRRQSNKSRRIAKAQKLCEKIRERKARKGIVRGAARARRRQHIQPLHSKQQDLSLRVQAIQKMIDVTSQVPQKQS